MSREPTPADPERLDLDDDVERDVVDPAGPAFARLVAVMAKLRSPTGCPWDREQTHRTLARHLLEETYEVLEAIDDDDPDGLREELGDLVLQVVFHAYLAYERDAFTIADVCDELRSKLVRRHPHVFGTTEVTGAEEVLANWERLKREEKGREGVMAGLPPALPALARAAKVSKRASQVGFDWPDLEARLRDVHDELAELELELRAAEPDAERVEAELGDVLFAVASLARKAGVEPESALRRSVRAFERRFAAMERMAASDGMDLESLSDDRWARYWQRAKSEEQT